jgi:tetratricopeptide (TPR) repeat protein/WD40 repeat protein
MRAALFIGTLKPSNILLSSQNDLIPKVADFGLAKRLDDDQGATATGSIMGTPAYMAPEQAFGGSKHVAPTADVYSIGAILYECLTGRPPFRGATIADTLDQVRQTQPVSVRLLQPQVPRDLETIVHKCLRKEPSQRYVTAGELSDDLRRYLRGDAIKARRENRFEAAVRIFRRYPLASSFAATAVGLLLFIAVGSSMFARRLNIELDRSSKAEQAALLGQANAMVGRAQGIRRSRRPGQRFEALSTIRKAAELGRQLHQPAEWFEQLRDEAIAAMLLPDIYTEQWREEPAPPLSADFSDDHCQYAVSFVEMDDIVIRRFDDHSERFRIPKISKSTRVSFLGSSSLFLHGLENFSCEMWDVSGASPRKKWRLDSGAESCDFSYDGSVLAISNPTDIQIVDTQSWQIRAKLPSSPFTRQARVAVHPTQPLIAICAYLQQPSVQLRNWMTGETQEFRPGEGTDDYDGYTGIDWSPDGRRLFVVNGHENAQHWYELDLKTHRLELKQTDRPSTLQAGGGPTVRFNARGDRILAAGWLNSLTILDADVDSSIFGGGSMLGMGAHHCWLRRADERAAYAGFAVRPDHPRQMGLVSMADAREAKIVIPAKTGVLSNATMDPTGNWIVGTDAQGLIIVDAFTGRRLLKWPLKDLYVRDIAFDRDGHFFLNGPSGCFQWPYRVIESIPQRIVLGIPVRVYVPHGNNVEIGSSDDGLTITAGAFNGYGTQEYAGCWIKPQGEPAARKVESGFGNAVSPNGRYAITNFDQAYVWDCQGGIQLINKLGPGYGNKKFSRDGNWLLAGNKRVPTNTWSSDVSYTEGTACDMSDDGSQILTSREDGVICLTDAASGKVVARLEWSEHMQVPTFSPEGQRITGWTESGVVLLDLRRIRTKLAEMGLDWNAPAYAEDNHADQPSSRIESAQLAPELQGIETADQLADLVDQSALEEATAALEPSDASPQKHPDLLFAGAKVAIDRCEYELALKLLDQTCQLLPEAITPRQWRAYLLAEMRLFERAIDDADWVLERIEEPDFRLLRAEWNYRAGHFDAAIADCSAVIEQDKKWKQHAYGQRAACYEAMGEANQAAADQAKFLELTSVDVSTLNMAAGPMSGCDISLRHPTIALRVVRKIQSLSVELDEEIEHTIGRVLCRNDLFDESAKWLEEHLATGEGKLDGLDLAVLAMAYHRLGQVEKARQTFDRAQAWQPTIPLDFTQRRLLQILRAEMKKHVVS